MHLAISCSIFLSILTTHQALTEPLTVVADKSGEQQVKEALKKAEQEAEKAAKDGNQKDSKDNDSRSMKLSTRSQEKSSSSSASETDQDESNKRMKEMAAKLNSLVVKFQKKVIANKLHNALQRRVALSKALEKNSQGKRAAQNQKSPFDVGNLDPLASMSNSMANSYKEDTKLEDRLAIEAEEEKKFNNGETYDDDGGYHDTPLKSYAGTTSLSPKEQASQEMQRYNALISSESSRELSQIQDEISKATQSSMGKVSVQGENPSVSAEQQPNNAAAPSLDLGSLGGLNSQSISGINGLGSLDASSNGLNIGNQLDGASLSGFAGSPSTESFAGNIGVTGESQTENQEIQSLQNSPGMISAGAETQGNGQETQTGETDIAAAQNLFNKKSNIIKNKKKTKIARKIRKSKISKKKN